MRRLRSFGMGFAALISMSIPADFASAYLYWVQPDFSGLPVRGDEPGITVPLTKATDAEIQANLLWSLRAALNVAALQCQFSASLMTVRNYNTILSQHGDELTRAYTALGGHFRRTLGKKWQSAFDSHTTKTYNGFSTMHAQYGFCETAGKIGRLALAARKGELAKLATAHMREIRNSLVPVGDRMFAFRPRVTIAALPSLDPACWDKRGNFKKQCVSAS